MPAIEPLCHLIGIHPSNLSKEENMLLEIDLFLLICEELKEIFREQYKNYFILLKLTKEKENTMLESTFMPCIITDILSTKDYTLKGIALYANTHEDIIQEAYAGLNPQPSVELLRKIIELHRTVRRELYHNIMKKIFLEYTSAPKM